MPAGGAAASLLQGNPTLSLGDITVGMADALCPPFSSWPGVYQAFLSMGFVKPLR